MASIDELLNQGWPGVTVSPDSVYQAMAALRRLFGDDPILSRRAPTVKKDDRSGGLVERHTGIQDGLIPIGIGCQIDYPLRPPRFS